MNNVIYVLQTLNVHDYGYFHGVRDPCGYGVRRNDHRVRGGLCVHGRVHGLRAYGWSVLRVCGSSGLPIRGSNGRPRGSLHRDLHNGGSNIAVRGPLPRRVKTSKQSTGVVINLLY